MFGIVTTFAALIECRKELIRYYSLLSYKTSLFWNFHWSKAHKTMLACPCNTPV